MNTGNEKKKSLDNLIYHCVSIVELIAMLLLQKQFTNDIALGKMLIIWSHTMYSDVSFYLYFMKKTHNKRQ